METDARRGSLPAAALVGVTVFALVWAPAYVMWYGPRNFLWFCDIAAVLTIVGTWRSSPLLLSSQLCSNFIVGALWGIDFFGYLALGFHPVGGTAYMFMPEIPAPMRALSFFHLVLPLYLTWAVRRVGYDPRGWRLQTAIAWLILPITWLVTDPSKNINWVFGLDDRIQETVHPLVYLAVLFAWYPLVFYWPVHWVCSRVLPSRQASPPVTG